MKEHPISQLSPFTDYIALSPLAPIWLLFSSSSGTEQRPKPAENYLVVWGFFAFYMSESTHDVIRHPAQDKYEGCGYSYQ